MKNNTQFFKKKKAETFCGKLTENIKQQVTVPVMTFIELMGMCFHRTKPAKE